MVGLPLLWKVLSILFDIWKNEGQWDRLTLIFFLLFNFYFTACYIDADAADEVEQNKHYIQSRWCDLPDLLLEEIFSYLSIRERYYASLVIYWFLKKKKKKKIKMFLIKKFLFFVLLSNKKPNLLCVVKHD
jgi:hypothetical protein